MDDIQKELAVRRRITSIYNQVRAAFDSKEAYDSYLETVEDIIYKLSFDIDVAEIEQQVQDYVRQQAALTGTTAAADAPTYAPVSMGAVMQPVPTAQVEMDKEGKLLISSTARPGRQQWQVMAQASGWTDGAATRRALQDAFASIFI